MVPASDLYHIETAWKNAVSIRKKIDRDARESGDGVPDIY
jgi:hypothetical protein